jgi:hypothetical protein
MGAFPLGWVVATPGALEVLEEVGKDPLCYLIRHASGDWARLLLTIAGRMSSPVSYKRSVWHTLQQ